MKKHGSKITALMLVAVFCAFAFAGCGNSSDNATDTPANEIEQSNETEKNTTDKEKNDSDAEIAITVTSPAEGDTVEGGHVNVEGTATGTANPGSDKIYFELTTNDGKKLGKGESLISDLDNAFSTDLKYELSDTMEKDDNGAVEAKLRAYVKNDKASEKTAAAEKTLTIKVK